MNIAKLNDIFTNRGAAAALASARAAMMDDWIIRALENGTWEPGKKSEPKPAPKYAEMRPLRTMPARVGKTAKSGGLAASRKRKLERSMEDQKLRASMRGGASNKGK